MKSQNSTKLIWLASMPEVLDLIGYEFPGHNYLHPRPIQSVVCVEFRSVPACPFQGPRIA